MSHSSDDDGRPLSRPSSLPNDREYEAAASQVKRGFKRSPIPDDRSSGEAELRKGYNEARLNAQTKVVAMTPELLTDYKDRLKGEISARQTYGVIVFILVLFWLITVAIFIRDTGHGIISLDASVLVALTTGATISIVGLLGTVITYYFTKSNEQISLYKELFKIMIDEERK